jgi:hypothetical protein
MKHKEYNAYKHGLKVFPSRRGGDFLKFLECEHQPESRNMRVVKSSLALKGER